MDRGVWVVLVEHGTRFLGRFPFDSQTQAEKFVASATRQGFRVQIEGEPEAIAPPPLNTDATRRGPRRMQGG